MTIALGDSPFEIEAKLLFSVIVAGKSAKFASAALWKLVSVTSKRSPFNQIRDMIKYDMLYSKLREARTGNYLKIESAFRQIVTTKIDFATCTPADLEKIHGIGPKTSRFFIMWIRPTEVYAALDVHILRWMRERGVDAPKSTPSLKKYAKLEKVFIEMAAARKKTPRQLDEEIWVAASQKRPTPA